MAFLGSQLRQTALCGGPMRSTSTMEGVYHHLRTPLLMFMILRLGIGLEGDTIDVCRSDTGFAAWQCSWYAGVCQ